LDLEVKDHIMEQDRGKTGSEGSYDEQRDKESAMLPDAALEDGTPEVTTPSDEVDEGMLPRDIGRKTAYYDYAAEKQLSQADAKLFYQRSQADAGKTGGSNWGNSQHSPTGSPVLMPKSVSNVFDQEQAGMRRSWSTSSMMSSHGVPPRWVLAGQHWRRWCFLDLDRS
jgi:AMP deaminase